MLWGAQAPDAGTDPRGNNTTRSHPFVFRYMYLSVFMFTGEHRVEQNGELTMVRLPVRFRSGLEVGDYPYPFWHSERKWLSYQRARELLFVIEALSGRHLIVTQIEQDKMPPGGIADAAARDELLALARAFAAVGDRAFAHEQEPTRD